MWSEEIPGSLRVGSGGSFVPLGVWEQGEEEERQVSWGVKEGFEEAPGSMGVYSGDTRSPVSQTGCRSMKQVGGSRGTGFPARGRAKPGWDRGCPEGTGVSREGTAALTMGSRKA